MYMLRERDRQTEREALQTSVCNKTRATLLAKSQARSETGAGT